MSNEQDQTFVQRALPDAVRSLVKVLPTLCAPEALIVGKELKSLFALDSVTRKSGGLTVPTCHMRRYGTKI
ncbi:hypothetical protein C8R31_10684 [Nitrosospira sp. Nsp2]|nr:hypothetical protein C8R31_10684 [Nitrosospira sp. Nsp2]